VAFFLRFLKKFDYAATGFKNETLAKA